MKIGRIDGRIPFISGGSGERCAVVFFGANALFQPLDRGAPAQYARLVSRLLPFDYRYLILGYDPDPPPHYGFPQIVDDFAAILRAQAAPADVIGVSFGGFVAQRLGADHPALLRRLVLLVSAHRFSPAGLARMKQQEALMRAGDLQGFVRDMALLFRRPWYNFGARLALAMSGAAIADRLNDRDTMLALYERLFTGFDNTPWTQRIRTPTLVLGATRDQFFDVAAYRETAALIPGARLHLVKDETHFVPLERPQLVQRVIREFLASVTREP